MSVSLDEVGIAPYVTTSADPLTVENGSIRVPDGPGLGIEVDEAALERENVE